MSKPIYESSSQFKHWRFSKQNLAKKRHTLNHLAVKAIQSTLEADEPGSSQNVQFINADEELLLIKLYMSKIPQLCTMFRFTEEVEATAISYLKRFYLSNTVMDWHPKNVMLTTLFLASKVTNNPISIEAYASRIPNTSQSDVLDLEFLVAQSIKFDFAVHHAHRALYGLWLDFQSLPDEVAPSQELYQETLSHIRKSRITDSELLYTPSQIAIACLALCDPALARSWLSSKFSQDSMDKILAVIEDVGAMVTTHGKPPNVEAVRDVDRRLRICTNPERIPGTKAYTKKQEEEEQKESEKRNRKAQDIQRTMESDDPFGNSLTEDQQAVTILDDDDD